MNSSKDLTNSSSLQDLSVLAQQELLKSSDSLHWFQADRDSVNPSMSSRLVDKLHKILRLEASSRFIYSDNLETLLPLNNLHYRRSLVNTNGNRSQIPIITLNDQKEIIVIINKGSRFEIYHPNNDTTEYLNYRPTTHEEGYEVYATMPSEMNSLWKLYRFLFPAFSTDLYYSVSLALGITLFTMFSPILTSKIVSDVVPSGDIALIINAFLIGIIVTVINLVLNWWQKYFLIRINTSVSLRLQVAAYDRAMKLPLSFIKKYSVGDFSSRLSELQQVAEALSGSSLSGILSILYIVGYGGLMISYDPGLALVTSIVVVLLSLVQLYFLKVQFTNQERLVAIQSDVYNTALQCIGAMPQIRINQSEPFLLKNWFDKLILATSRQFRITRASDYSSAISTGLQTLGLSVIYSTILYKLINSNSKTDVLLSTSSFIVFTTTYSGFIARLESLIELISRLISTTAVQWKRALVILQSDLEQGYSSPNLIGLNSDLIQGEISLRELTFAYDGSTNYVLDNLSCEFKPGKFNVIFGPSGCGKSTIFNLLLRFYNPSVGSIHFDGVPIDKIRIMEYRKAFGVILQKSILPAGSIKDAISAGLNYEDNDIWEALEFANAKEEVERMPMKLSTILSEAGSNLSGGQRQRISIARAILRKPRILLEDEATSALDSSSQQIISDNLKSTGVTRIVIAHRLSVIRNCDHIVVIKNKKLESQGEFDILKQSSPYLRSSIQASN